MLSQSKFAVVLWLVALALLPIRMANAHLHLCLDGQERPVSMHLQDVSTHRGVVDAPSGHNDIDVDVSTSSVSTKQSKAALSPAILGAYVMASLLLPQYVVVTPRIEVENPPPTFVFDLRPPTRGPPA